MWPYLAEETTWLDAESLRRPRLNEGDLGSVPSAEEIERLVARGRALRSRFIGECLAAAALWLWRLPGRLATPGRRGDSLRPVGS